MNKQSKGHKTFKDNYEYFTQGKDVYRAEISLPIMPDGYRCGRWFCYIHAIDLFLSSS